MIIYKATNIINGKCYIGQTIRSLKDRINQHIIVKNNKSRTVIFKITQDINR